MIDRKQEVPHEGPMCDLLWSDPDGSSLEMRFTNHALSKRRDHRMGHVTKRSGILIRKRRGRAIQPQQRYRTGRKSTPASHGGVQSEFHLTGAANVADYLS